MILLISHPSVAPELIRVCSSWKRTAVTLWTIPLAVGGVFRLLLDDLQSE